MVLRSVPAAVLIAFAALALQPAAQAQDIKGTQRDDVLVGTKYYDYIRGLGGDDRLVGGGGRDALFGGAGDDRIVGGASYDYIADGLGNDLVSGGASEDNANLQIGRDVARMGPGNDLVIVRPDRYRDVIDCGVGGDDIGYFFPRRDRKDRYVGCETVARYTCKADRTVPCGRAGGLIAGRR